MGRWTQYDEDEYRLPEGMKRVGYDADSGRYYFRDSAGQLYQGPEGSEFGDLTPVSSAPIAVGDSEADLEASTTRSDGYQPLATDGFSHPRHPVDSPYRILFPFFLGIGVIVLLAWKLFFSVSIEIPDKPSCPSEGTRPYMVRPGDTCWKVAEAHQCPWEDFQRLNSEVDCDHLMPGMSLCVPQPDPET